MAADRGQARANLAERCATQGGAACAVLGEYRARGAFGAEERAKADADFARACESAWVSGACDQRADDYVMDLLPEAEAQPGSD